MRLLYKFKIAFLRLFNNSAILHLSAIISLILMIVIHLNQKVNVDEVTKNILRDFCISYLSGYLVYFLTVVIPEKYRLKKMKRYVISYLRKLSMLIKKVEGQCFDVPISEEQLTALRESFASLISIASEMERRVDCFDIEELDVLYRLHTNQYAKILSSLELTVEDYNASGGFQEYASEFKVLVKDYKKLYRHILLNDYSVIADKDDIRIP